MHFLQLHRRDLIQQLHQASAYLVLARAHPSPSPMILSPDWWRESRRGASVIAPFVLDGPTTGEAFRAYVEEVLAADLLGRPLGRIVEEPGKRFIIEPDERGRELMARVNCGAHASLNAALTAI